MRVPGQRATAPWGQHNYWGLFTDPNDLPNVAGSSFQQNGLQRGDVAWSDSDNKLYVCIDPTLGAAVWREMVTTTTPGSGGVETARAKDDNTLSVSGGGNVVFDQFFGLTSGTHLVSWYHELINNDVSNVALATTVEVTPDGGVATNAGQYEQATVVPGDRVAFSGIDLIDMGTGAANRMRFLVTTSGNTITSGRKRAFFQKLSPP